MITDFPPNRGSLNSCLHLQTVSGETEEAERRGFCSPTPAMALPLLQVRALQLASATANLLLALGLSGTVVQAVHCTSTSCS